MDNIIIFLLIFGVFVFQTYSNYKKEQKEATARKLRKEPIPGDSVEDILKTSKWLDEPSIKPVVADPEPTAKSFQKRKHQGSIDYQPSKYSPMELPTDLLKEYRNLSERKETEALKKMIANQNSYNNDIKRLEPHYLPAEKTEPGINASAFDLREAIIMSSILKRPYQ